MQRGTIFAAALALACSAIASAGQALERAVDYFWRGLIAFVRYVGVDRFIPAFALTSEDPHATSFLHYEEPQISRLRHEAFTPLLGAARGI